MKKNSFYDNYLSRVCMFLEFADESGDVLESVENLYPLYVDSFILSDV